MMGPCVAASRSSRSMGAGADVLLDHGRLLELQASIDEPLERGPSDAGVLGATETFNDDVFDESLGCDGRGDRTHVRCEASTHSNGALEHRTKRKLSDASYK